MTGGKFWAEEENQLLIGIVADELSIQEILDSGKFPDRTDEAMKDQRRRLGGGFLETTKQTLKKGFGFWILVGGSKIYSYNYCLALSYNY